jgi:hypothetical protein
MTTTIQFGKDKYHLQGEMESWCTKHIGENPPHKNWFYSKPNDWEGLGSWGMSSMFGSTFFYFKHEKDATAFALRWA